MSYRLETAKSDLAEARLLLGEARATLQAAPYHPRFADAIARLERIGREAERAGWAIAARAAAGEG